MTQKDKFKFIDILLILSLLIVVVSFYKIETFADVSNNIIKMNDSSGNIPATNVPSWKPPKAGDEQFMYTVLFIVLILITIVSLSLFVYTFTINEPSFLYATIGLSSMIIFILVYLSKY